MITVLVSSEILVEVLTTGNTVHAKVEDGLPEGCELVDIDFRDHTVAFIFRAPAANAQADEIKPITISTLEPDADGGA